MSTTGFKLSDGRDLSLIFETYATGTKADPTGFVVASGLDLNSVFAKNTSGTYTANDTGYKVQTGQDLRLLMEPLAPLTVTIGGTTTIANSGSGNVYRYIFSTSGNFTISINKNITNFNVIVVGGGGAGSTARFTPTTLLGGGGAGGGIGLWSFQYTKNASYNITVASAVTASSSTGNTSSFVENKTGGVGIQSTGGAGGNLNSTERSISGVSSAISTISGTLITKNGGNGGAGAGSFPKYPTDSETLATPLSVLGYSFSYGGGGTYGSTGSYGTPGLNGRGGNAGTPNFLAACASSPGSGGGGGNAAGAGTNGGYGGRGEVVVIFQYP